MSTTVAQLEPAKLDADLTSGLTVKFSMKKDLHNSSMEEDGKTKKNPHHRRKPSKKKRKWKPYSKMTWEEKKEAEERETIKADRVRSEMMNRGRPVAPYNTTQFIMAEHNSYELDNLDEGCSSKSSTSGTYSAQMNNTDSPTNMNDLIEAEYADSPHMAPEFISQDFSEAYERVQEENLSTMTRNELVVEHISLEKSLSYLQDQLAEEKNINNSYSYKLQSIEEELEILKNDNQRLVCENMKLKGSMTAKENYTFQTSDGEFEAPHSDESYSSYSDSSPSSDNEVDMECTYVSENNKTNGTSNKAAQERDYEADIATSEEEKREKRKRRRPQKERDSSTIQNNREPDTQSSLDESTATATEGNTRTEDDSSPKTVKRRVTSRSFTGTFTTPSAHCKNGAGSVTSNKQVADTMEAESYSNGDKGAATASMESLSEENL